MREPCFDNLLRVLRRERPARPTLFELFLNGRLYTQLAGFSEEAGEEAWLIAAFRAAGYDYATVRASDFVFPRGESHRKHSRSLNEGALIVDRESFARYPWPNPEDFGCARLDTCARLLPAGMKMIVFSPDGVLENVIGLTGYENLCLMLTDDPELVGEIFQEVGSRLLRYYELAVRHEAVGAIIGNDDWGFIGQTMLSPADMRRYVFPWHKRIVAAARACGKPAILHSCGDVSAVMDDIIHDMRYAGKHSYEDKILPVEQAYERWGREIAILGGIDVDFLCRSTPRQIQHRAAALLQQTEKRGGYALGSGNSIPDYVPDENYFAMTSVID